MRTYVTVALVVVMGTTWGSGFTPAQVGVLPDGTRYVKGHLLVGLTGGVPPVGSRVFGGKVLRAYSSAILLDIGSGMNVIAMAKVIATRPRVAYAEPDRVYRGTDYVPNDPQWGLQWGAERLDCPKAWDYQRNATGIKVAIIDSGADYTHPDLAANYAGGFDYVDSDPDPTDIDGHGTLVAGAVAAVADNGVGVAGSGFNCQFMAIRVGTANAYPESLIAAGIDYARTHDAHIINLSLGGYGQSSTIHAALATAAGAGVVICAAAGNDATTQTFYPAGYAECISVAATAPDNSLSSFTNRGSWVLMAAPGTGILSTALGGGYTAPSGTSMASPLVAGAAALVYQAVGGVISAANAAVVRGALLNTSIAWTNDIGGGRANAYNAILQYSNVPPSWVSSDSGASWIRTTPHEIALGQDGTYSISLFDIGQGGGALTRFTRTDNSGNLVWHGLLFTAGSAKQCLAIPSTGPYGFVLREHGPSQQLFRFRLSDGVVETETSVGPASVGPPGDMAVDTTGNLVFVDPGIGPSVRTVKVDPSGAQIWTQNYLDGYDSVIPISVKVSATGDVYSLARTRQAGDVYRITLIKYSSSGTFQWARNWSGPDSAHDLALGLAIGGGGGGGQEIVGVTGLMSGIVAAYESGLYAGISIYDTAGGPQFDDTFTCSTDVRYYTGGISIDAIGNSFVSAVEKGNITPHPVALDLRSYDLDGGLSWNARYEFTDANIGDMFCTAPVLDQSGNIYVAVFLGVTLGIYDSILLKFGPTGNFLWAGRYFAGTIDRSRAGDLLVVLADGTAVMPRAGTYGGAEENRILGYNVPGGGNTSTGNVGGHIDLDGYAGSGSVSGELEFREPGTSAVLFTRSLTIGPDGDYSTASVPQGSYDVSLKATNWLRQTVPGIYVVNRTISQDFGLVNGDADGDNTVTLFDLNTELVYFGSDGSEGGDIDWDGLVGLFDLNLVLINFGVSGDP